MCFKRFISLVVLLLHLGSFAFCNNCLDDSDCCHEQTVHLKGHHRGDHDDNHDESRHVNCCKVSVEFATVQFNKKIDDNQILYVFPYQHFSTSFFDRNNMFFNDCLAKNTKFILCFECSNRPPPFFILILFFCFN